MPRYDYRCVLCGHTEIVTASMDDTDPRKCPECNGRSMERQLSTPSVRVKGGTPKFHGGPARRTRAEAYVPTDGIDPEVSDE